jgi:hypothetical protein
MLFKCWMILKSLESMAHVSLERTVELVNAINQSATLFRCQSSSKPRMVH